MIAVDMSALAAVLLREPEADMFDELLVEHPSAMTAATKVEWCLVARRRLGLAGLRSALTQIEIYAIEVVPFDVGLMDEALDGLQRHAQGRGAAPAALNYGDLFSYALAKRRDLPLLYKGGDFARTDVRSAAAELAR